VIGIGEFLESKEFLEFLVALVTSFVMLFGIYIYALFRDRKERNKNEVELKILKEEKDYVVVKL